MISRAAGQDWPSIAAGTDRASELLDNSSSRHGIMLSGIVGSSPAALPSDLVSDRRKNWDLHLRNSSLAQAIIFTSEDRTALLEALQLLECQPFLCGEQQGTSNTRNGADSGADIGTSETSVRAQVPLSVHIPAARSRESRAERNRRARAAARADRRIREAEKSVSAMADPVNGGKCERCTSGAVQEVDVKSLTR
jgi:hypothetical protein